MKPYRTWGRVLLAGAIMMPGWGAHPARAGRLEGRPEHTALLTCHYLRFVMSQQVEAQAVNLAREAREEDRAEIGPAAARFRANRMNRVREDLVDAFGEAAEERFSAFVTAYTSGERGEDLELLEQVTAALQLNPPPVDYAGLRTACLEGPLKGDLQDIAGWLGEVQTWIALRRTRPDVPPLAAWLDRAARPAAAPGKPPVRSLADAEADPGAFVPEEEPGDSPLDALDSARQKRREKAMREAEAGMKQVAAERKAAEDELAARKLAAAQAEADAMKKQAEKLAGVEKEAMEQRKNSFGNRLKSIVSATVGAATGAMTGGIGSEAGRRAADALFNNK